MILFINTIKELLIQETYGTSLFIILKTVLEQTKNFSHLLWIVNIIKPNIKLYIFPNKSNKPYLSILSRLNSVLKKNCRQPFLTICKVLRLVLGRNTKIFRGISVYLMVLIGMNKLNKKLKHTQY
ncbi:hypothetical protein HJG60_008623 [Phyllostomus discolor]|uniref:Uncharacterized protein n=1 Tax=Phyllostomus discolor TaxID=89673 RepID=A0A834DNL4_9CHIR|nr:hypothetical protein HJG60_008623 [Phyllostomus discolor]